MNMFDLNQVFNLDMIPPPLRCDAVVQSFLTGRLLSIHWHGERHVGLVTGIEQEEGVRPGKAQTGFNIYLNSRNDRPIYVNFTR